MALPIIPYPAVDPVALRVGPYALYWYALAYIGGMFCMWLLAVTLVKRDRYWNGVVRPSTASVDYLIVYVFLGTAIGGRLGEAIIKPSVYLSRPTQIFAVWYGGGSFHGAMLGACLAIWVFSFRHRISFWTAVDICSPGGALGLGFGRLANFIRPELWGRPSNVPWAMIFPAAGPLPRHPSQLYEAALEGLCIFVAITIAIRLGALKRPGLVAGLFCFSYGAARIFCEFFRAPDPDVPDFPLGVTLGMILSAPMVVVGIFVMLRSHEQSPATKNGAGYTPRSNIPDQLNS